MFHNQDFPRGVSVVLNQGAGRYNFPVTRDFKNIPARPLCRRARDESCLVLSGGRNGVWLNKPRYPVGQWALRFVTSRYRLFFFLFPFFFSEIGRFLQLIVRWTGSEMESTKLLRQRQPLTEDFPFHFPDTEYARAIYSSYSYSVISCLLWGKASVISWESFTRCWLFLSPWMLCGAGTIGTRKKP